ncbi:MAG: hypothetical protein FJX56_03280 [Alphaproteobacteria bacterium]|nr:hypothetical protein [Alphaproteobacteria bacterium]
MRWPRRQEAAAPAPKARPPTNLRGVLLVALSIVVVAAAGAAIWYAYEEGLRRGIALSPPLIQADTRPTKVAPEEPGGEQVPDQDKLVFDVLDPAAAPEREERLLPTPEEPLRRPVAEPPSLPQPDVLSAPVAGTPPAPEPAVLSAPSSEPAPRPEQKPVVAAHTVTSQATAPDGGYRVQLASFRDERQAAQAWQHMLARHRSYLGGLQPSLVRADLGRDKGVYHRVQAGPIPDAATARALCAALKGRGQDCLVVAP